MTGRGEGMGVGVWRVCDMEADLVVGWNEVCLALGGSVYRAMDGSTDGRLFIFWVGSWPA